MKRVFFSILAAAVIAAASFATVGTADAAKAKPKTAKMVMVKKHQPMNILPRVAMAPASAAVVGTTTAVGLHYGWWSVNGLHTQAGASAATAAKTSAALGSAAGGIIAAAAFLTGYEALGCRSLGVDPLNMCLTHSWRVANWRSN